MLIASQGAIGMQVKGVRDGQHQADAGKAFAC
jgi:hypothetical protein